MKQIQKRHFATLLKYLGISFITWALSHGFFTGQRQIITAVIGVIFFSIGTLLLRESEDKNYSETILYSVIFAISLGAFTGGLQHFPDSPERSLLIVPLGFFFSVLSFYALEQHIFLKKTHIFYLTLGTVFVVLSSLLFFVVVEKWYLGEHAHARESPKGEISESIQERETSKWEDTSEVSHIHDDTHAH
jgi:drug/metabolite transporter (DMT)-like permease